MRQNVQSTAVLPQKMADAQEQPSGTANFLLSFLPPVPDVFRPEPTTPTGVSKIERVKNILQSYFSYIEAFVFNEAENLLRAKTVSFLKSSQSSVSLV